MRSALFTFIGTIGLGAVGAAAFLYAGLFNVAADDPHSALVYSVMETARFRSIRMRAAGAVVPAGYDSEANIVSAAGHFAEHCAACHGSPAARPGEFTRGMYPPPPSLTRVAEKYTPAQLFWIIKHGIKMSGMPAMAADGDAMLWSTVAFLQQLPQLSAQGYNALLLKAQSGDGHGMSMPGTTSPGPGAPAARHSHTK